MREVYNITDTCFSCMFCELYEDENVLPSTTHICNITDELIYDIEESYCEHHKGD